MNESDLINNINNKIVGVLNEEELHFFMTQYNIKNLEDFKTEFYSKILKDKSEELYDNITCGEEIKFLLETTFYINYLNNYFIKKYKTTPLLLAIRHSYSMSNIKYIKYLLENKIYFDLHYRNESNNSLFDLLPYLFKNIRKYYIDYMNGYGDGFCVSILKIYLNEVYDLFFKNLDELGKTNTDGNTIYMNVLLCNIESYQKFMFKKLLYLMRNKNVTLIKNLLNLQQINKNNETFLELFAKSSFKSRFKYNFFDYIFGNNIIDLSDFVRIDNEGKTTITHFIENKEIDFVIEICQKINNESLELKSKINIPDNSGYTPLMHALKLEEYVYWYRYKLWKFIKLLDNLNYVNDKKESAFYLACKHGYMDSVIYIYTNDLTNTDIYPDNEPSSLYYLIQNDFIHEKCKSFNNGIKKEIVEEKNRIKLYDFFNYGKNRNLFRKNSEKYDIKDVLDIHRINIQNNKKNEAIYQFYYVLQKKIFRERYKKMLLDKDILLPELFGDMFKILYPVTQYSILPKNKKIV